VTLATEDIVKLLLAILIGGLIGAEREFRDKAAGFRTLIFICVGATLFTMFSMRFGPSGDPSRVAANIVSGIGFLGAGVILREGGRIMGLTTASTIWLAAALGMGLGAGHYLISLTGTGLILVVLWVFPGLEQWIDGFRTTRIFEIRGPFSPDREQRIAELLRECRLRADEPKQCKDGECQISTWHVVGRTQGHDRFVQALMSDPRVTQLTL
jgi:putative Mg2+ transporter-C (MgtC) family protein